MEIHAYERNLLRLRKLADEIASMPVTDMLSHAGQLARANPCPNPMAGDTTRDDVELLRATLNIDFALRQADRRASMAEYRTKLPLPENVTRMPVRAS